MCINIPKLQHYKGPLLIDVQDAHEFLNYLLNECSELLEKEAKAKLGPPATSLAVAQQQQQQQQQRLQSGQQASTSEPSSGANGQQAEQQTQPPDAAPPTFIHELFQVRSLMPKLSGLMAHTLLFESLAVHAMLEVTCEGMLP